MSVASVAASFPATNARAANGDDSGSADENFTFHGHTSWEMCRYNRFEVALGTGLRSLNPASPPERRRRPTPELRESELSDLDIGKAAGPMRPTGWVVRATWEELCQRFVLDTMASGP